MNREQHSSNERRAEIEEHLRFTSEAEQKAWIKAVSRRERDRIRLETNYQHLREQTRHVVEEPARDQDRAITEMFARFKNLPKRSPKRRPSRLLNPDLAALDE